jgi:hypothetical protein
MGNVEGGFCRRLRNEALQLTLFDTHIQDDSGYAGHTASIKRGALFCLHVIDVAGESNDAMVNLDSDRTGREAFIVLNLGKNLLLDLDVIFHDVLRIAGDQNAAFAGDLIAEDAQPAVGQR